MGKVSGLTNKKRALIYKALDQCAALASIHITY
jgi:hypothetical protein